MINNVNWTFPLPRTHTGMLLGNATTGLMIWGENNHLKITIGRADLWDHRGGMAWTEKQNYRDIRRFLEENDEKGLRKLFETDTEHTEGQPGRPSVIPVGRIDLLLGEDAELQAGNIDIKTGICTVKYTKSGKECCLKVVLSMTEQVFVIKCSDNDEITISPQPEWELLTETLSKISFTPSVKFQKNIEGWFQPFPADSGIGVGFKKQKNVIWIANNRGEEFATLQSTLLNKIDNNISNGFDSFCESSKKWWKEYWKNIPEIDVPNETLGFIYYYGLYKFAGLTNPSGIAATLQGPWIEEYQLPPWSSDYHFNINVQMCYWPAFKANKLEHLLPIFDLVWSWREKLQQNAKLFIGIDDGYMLPHAVDDQCTCMGGFWTGVIDHACTAWIAQMMFDYCQYSGNSKYLADVAFPFMKGAMQVYEAMLEKNEDKYELPVSVSPEYRGAAMNAWGKNASFQLASIHRLCENLITAADLLKEDSNPAWNDILNKLPKFCSINEGGREKIALWDGTNLEESHRHHSHLGAICPFDAIDIYDEKLKTIVADSINHWIMKGMGLWSGWCVPWASMIHSRLQQGDSAELLLEIWERVYTNEGYGTLHDCNFPGITIMGSSSFRCTPVRKEIMQMDAGMGAVVAIQDMLMHFRRGVCYLFNGVPARWRNAGFKNMLAEGGFLISADRNGGKTSEVKIKSQLGGTLKLANPWPEKSVKITNNDGSSESQQGPVLNIHSNKGEKFTLCCQ